MGLFDLFGLARRGKRREGRRAKEARRKELGGELAAAVDLYLEAELPDEAARVLLLRADAEASADRRIAFCAQAARTAADEEIRKKALGRKALLAFDVLKARGGVELASELVAVARDLEDAGELEVAADAYALAGDAEAEVRALTAAGAIERLEERLRASQTAARDHRELDVTLRRVADLDRTAERRAAIELARAYLRDHEDERVADLLRAIRARVARGPVVDLAIDGVERRCALGDEVTLGRGDATLVVASRAISRRHARVRRAPEGPVLEDLGTRNGTHIAGARLSAPMPIGAGLKVELGGEVPCAVAPAEDGRGVWVEGAGTRYLAPLGELVVGPWRVGHEVAGDESFVVLRTPDGASRPFLGGFELAARVELGVGDEIRAARGGAVALKVLSERGDAPRVE